MTERAAGPVFVLTVARSGSTLLRFMLDAHPELACPPETGLPALCAYLQQVWSVVDQRESAVQAAVRAAGDAVMDSYLARRGKSRYCEKTVGSARPEARFLCLYRHPMDMIASAAEACAWGLSGYGFDDYASPAPATSPVRTASPAGHAAG